MSEEEWGPWVKHHGRGCPCVGEYGQFQFCSGDIVEGTAGESAIQAIRDGFDPFVAWKWALVPTSNRLFECAKIIRYRLRKPRGITMLEEIARTPEPVDA